VKWYFVSRSAFFLALPLLELWVFRGEKHKVFPLLIAFFVALFFTIYFYYSIKKNKLSVIHPLLDTFLLSFFIPLTGGHESPFIPFYYAFILVGAILFYAPGAFAVATSSAIFYLFLILGEYRNFIPSSYFILGKEPFTETSLYLRPTIYILLFYFLAALSAYLAERLKRGLTELEKIRITTDDIVKRMEGGVLALDERGRIIYFNPYLASLLGLENIPGNIKDLGSAWEGIWREVREKERMEREMEVDGKVLFVKGAMLRDKKGKVIGSVFLIDDYTERKFIERMVTVGKISASIAHSLRNPVSSIKGAAELLSGNPEKDKKLIRIIREEVERIESMVKGFLAYAREEKLDKRKVPLRKIVDDVVNSVKLSPEFSKKKIEIKVKGKGEEVEVDVMKFKEAIYNVVHNAVKAMDKGRIEIKVDGRKIEIKDTGPGIPEEVREKIFEPFFTLDPKGTGLGLSITKKIVELHGGRIEVESEEGKGSVFAITL
ncbi:hypothetical protein DRQ20_04450, partial [bacterium]